MSGTLTMAKTENFWEYFEKGLGVELEWDEWFKSLSSGRQEIDLIEKNMRVVVYGKPDGSEQSSEQSSVKIWTKQEGEIRIYKINDSLGLIVAEPECSEPECSEPARSVQSFKAILKIGDPTSLTRRAPEFYFENFSDATEYKNVNELLEKIRNMSMTLDAVTMHFGDNTKLILLICDGPIKFQLYQKTEQGIILVDEQIPDPDLSLDYLEIQGTNYLPEKSLSGRYCTSKNISEAISGYLTKYSNMWDCKYDHYAMVSGPLLEHYHKVNTKTREIMRNTLIELLMPIEGSMMVEPCWKSSYFISNMDFRKYH